MRHERSVISEARARVGAGVFSLRDGIQEVMKHFEVILFWAVTVISMAAMIKLRHQQPSLWRRGLAEDIEGLWETVDAAGGRTAYRRAASGHGVRSARGTLSPEPHSRPDANAGRSIVAPDWSGRVRSLVYRAFTRIGEEQVPDAKTLAGLAPLVEPLLGDEMAPAG